MFHSIKVISNSNVISKFLLYSLHCFPKASENKKNIMFESTRRIAIFDSFSFNGFCLKKNKRHLNIVSIFLRITDYKIYSITSTFISNLFRGRILYQKP